MMIHVYTWIRINSEPIHKSLVSMIVRPVYLSSGADKHRKVSQWLQGIKELITLEAMTFKEKPPMFYRIRDPFLNYIGTESAKILQKGPYGLIWTGISREAHT